MTTLSLSEFGDAWGYLRDHEGLRVPYDLFPGGSRPGAGVYYNVGSDEATWNAYQWNPPQNGSYDEADPNASPKPSWADLLRALELRAILDYKLGVEYSFEASAEHRAELTDKDVLRVDGGLLRVNDGLDHMTGLLQMVEHATTAGQRLPHTVLQDSLRQPRPLWTEAARREVLSAAAHRENQVESAHVAVRQKVQALLAQSDDTSKTLAERKQIAKAAFTIVDNYPMHLAEAMAAYDPTPCRPTCRRSRTS